MPETLAELPESTIGMSILVLAVAALAHLCLRRWIGRKVRQEEAAGGDALAGSTGASQWLVRGLREAASPLVLLIWIHGFYVALNVVVPRANAPALVGPTLSAVSWIYGLSVVASAFWLFSRIGRLIELLLISISIRSGTTWDNVMLPLIGRAAKRTLPLFALMIGVPAVAIVPGLEEMFRSAASLLLIGIVAFVLLQVVDAAAALVLRQHRIDVRDNLQARAIHTQVVVLKKVAVSTIGIFALASMLMVFDSARQFGASILASAGVAGIIVGLAAQRSIATLLAGFQIALTQPIRVDDVVIVENEWGRIEEITLTYVVVRIWDLRRLVLPITYFIERPFQNWTRSSADILGTVFLHADYSVPLDALRAELTRILSTSTFWDGKVNVLQVTDAKEHTLEIRALASAADASLAWDLRCEVREKLIQFLQRNYPESLPRVRASVDARLPMPDISPQLASGLLK
jgi:small-conductance mechanosensitive channel